MNKVRQIKVEFSDGHVDVVRIDAERRVDTVGRLFQPLAVGALQRNGAKQDHHHQIQPPHLVGLSKAVDPPHLSLLVGVAKDARRMTTPRRDAVHEIFATVLCDVLAQLRQQPRRPLLLCVHLLRLQSHPESDIYLVIDFNVKLSFTQNDMENKKTTIKQ